MPLRIFVLLLLGFLLPVSAQRDPLAEEMSLDVYPWKDWGKLILDGRTKEEVFAFRQRQVSVYRQLHIFPATYELRKQPHWSVYGPVEDGLAWTAPSFYHLANPYLLISCTPPRIVNPICSAGQLFYHSKILDHIFRDEDALEWFGIAYTPQVQGIIHLTSVNAHDADFPFMKVDLSRSENIHLTWKAADPSVLSSSIRTVGLYHRGPGKNNLSPSDAKARVKLLQRGVKTVIAVQLWRKSPAQGMEEDLLFRIQVIPPETTALTEAEIAPPSAFTEAE